MVNNPAYFLVVNVVNTETIETILSSLNSAKANEIEFTRERIAWYIFHLRKINEFRTQQSFLSVKRGYISRPEKYKVNDSKYDCIHTALEILRSD